MTEFIDISDKNIKVDVYFNSKHDRLIGTGTICKVYQDDSGELHISTIEINGEMYSRVGLGLVKLPPMQKIKDMKYCHHAITLMRGGVVKDMISKEIE